MRYTLNTHTILFDTNPDHLNAYRRAIEIRERVLIRRGERARAAYRAKETYSLETDLGNGVFEIETVNIDRTRHSITYIRSEVVRA